MYHNILILLVYLAIFHFVVRTYDFYVDLLGWEKPFTPPFALNAKQLRALLNQRGILYTGIVEKQELTRLVDLSGPVTETDLADAINRDSDESSPETTTQLSNLWHPERSKHVVQEFSGSDHFYEQVEDSKDSAWVVHVVAERNFLVVNDVIWEKLISKLSPFGIRFGVLYCRIDPKMCHQRNWNTSRLLLALPRADLPKSNVVLHTYTRNVYRTQPILQWIYGLMKHNIKRINTGSELSSWLSQSCATDVCLLFISSLTLPPFFLSALSVKFTGRIKFGSCPQRALRSAENQLTYPTNSADESTETPNDSAAAAANENFSPEPGDTGRYVVVANGRTINYGRQRRQTLSFSVLKTYLKCFSPDINDVFLMSLAFANILAVMSLFDVHVKTPVNCVVHLFGTLLKYNFILLLVWLAVLSAINWKTTISVCKFLAAFLRRSAISIVGHRLITLFLIAVNNFKTLCGCFFVFNSVIYTLRRKFFAYTIRPSESWTEWLGSADIANPPPFFVDPRRFNNLFPFQDFRDADDLSSVNPALLSLIRQYEIERVRLNPSLNYDYILKLPCWNFSTETSDNWRSETGNLLCTIKYKRREKLCFRCRCVKSLKLKRLSKKLAKQPCKKCGFAGGVSRGDNNVDFVCCSGEPCVSAIKRENVATSCPICLDVFYSGDTVCQLPCQHVYHQRCILSWLLRDQPSCPCCRWPANETKEKCS